MGGKNYKETGVSAWRLLQYFQLLEKISRYISRYIIIFCVILKELRVYSKVFRGTPNAVVWNPRVPQNPF